MKLKLTGFKYYLNEVELKNYDEFEKKIKKLDIEITVDTNKLKVNTITKS